MRKISSRFTWYFKKGFPALWFGILLALFVGALVVGVPEELGLFLVAPVVMAMIGFFVLKKLVWNLVDEVYDLGDHLLVRNRGEEDRVPLSNVMHVDAATRRNPPRITLRLVVPGKFGSQFSFSPAAPWTLNPFARNEVAEDLIVRVDRARSERSGNPASS